MSSLPDLQQVRPVPYLCGGSRPDFLRDELLHEFVEQTAAANGDRVALRCGTEQLTYAELWQRSATLARALQARGVARGRPVVLWMERHIDAYVAMVAILRAGGIYVPTDPDWPVDRVAYMASDCGACGLLVSAPRLEPARVTCPVWVCDELCKGPESLPNQFPGRADAQVAPSDCAYIIYTSGTTGRPKGVSVSHRAICHFVRSEGSVLELDRNDIVFQGSSLSFDMSLEEIWPAWAVGATLLVGTKQMLRLGADLAAVLAAEGVTVWTCVPTLLAMQDGRIPSLRLLNLGGEACPPELARAWMSPGRRILNTYGPTEATITATFAELAPGDPVTIGRPLPNYTAYVLPIPGESTAPDEGQLYVGGPGVAMGYVGRPEITRERFVSNPITDRQTDDPILYRTGDRVRLTPQGNLEFLGRIDTQVKIRGHRIELSEIESVIVAVDGIKQAAVTVRQNGAGADILVAYVVPSPGQRCDESLLRARLQRQLPTYMIPAAFERIAELPMLTSGKVDRARLPAPQGTFAAERPGTAPVTASERAVHEIWGGVFAPAPVSIDDHFFEELGGHSVIAAAVVSALRRLPLFRHASMADIYNYPTIRMLAAQLDATRPNNASSTAAVVPVTSLRHFACGVAQAVGLLLVYGLFSLQWLIPYLSYAWLYNQEGFTRPSAILISLSLYLVAIPVMLVVGILAKWLILGRLRPGEYPLWGFTYFRWWLTQQLLDTVPVNYLGRSSLLASYYRLLGAKIGRGVLLDDVPIDAPDCVSIGDNSGFGSGAMLACCKVEDGKLKVGSIEVGRDCYIGASSVVGMNAVIRDGAVLDDLSCLGIGKTMGANERWAGSPARCVEHGLSRSSPAVSAARRGAFALAHAVMLAVFPLFAVLPLFPGMMLMTELDQNTDAYGFVLLSPVLAAAFVVTMCLQIAALKWLLVGRVKAGRIPVCSTGFLRHWLVHQLMDLSLDVANSLYATMYLNPWYRLLGVRLGARAEVSTASSISYDLLTIGAESFIADAVSLGAPRIDRGELVLRETVIGRRGFIGNSAVVPAGTRVGDGVLVGVLSIPPMDPAKAAQAGSSWFGTPAVYLPRRQISGAFGESSTFRPARALVAQRLSIEFVRVILPMTVMIALTSLLMSYLVDMDDAGWSLGSVAVLFPAMYLAYALVVGAFVAALKWLVIGRYRAAEKPLWNGFVWRSELVTSTYENLAVPLFANALRGTPFLPMYLRLLGCRIGRRVYLDTTDVTEFDMVSIGDDAALNRDSGPQTHLFEDRVMKIAPVSIGQRCVVGAGSIVLYDARMEDDSRLGELSMLMKGEMLPAGTRWEGSPARPCG